LLDWSLELTKDAGEVSVMKKFVRFRCVQKCVQDMDCEMDRCDGERGKRKLAENDICNRDEDCEQNLSYKNYFF
jgi:hypothetical protein